MDRWRGFTGTASPTSSRARRSMRTPVFRVASISKTMTAIAVMQLWEQALVEPDPADDYLRGYSLVPARAGFGPATLRHLLTHTAGVRAVRRPITGCVHRLHLHADVIPTSLRPTAVPARRCPRSRPTADQRPGLATRRDACEIASAWAAPHTFAPTDAFAVLYARMRLLRSACDADVPAICPSGGA